MREYVLLLPIIFIFHDMEEIIGFGWFFKNNPELFDRFPIITKAYKDFTSSDEYMDGWGAYCTYSFKGQTAVTSTAWMTVKK